MKRPFLSIALASSLTLTTQAAQTDFQRQCPVPDWWSTVSVDTRLDNREQLVAYWILTIRTHDHRKFFKAAYQAVLAHPDNPDIVVTAAHLMPNADPAYSHRTQLQDYALRKFFTYKTPGAQFPAADVTGIVLGLSASYNDHRNFDRARSIIERLLNQRKREVNDHELQLLQLEHARALDGQGRTDLAVASLREALGYKGSWTDRVRTQLEFYQTKLVKPIAPHAQDKAACDKQGGRWGRFGLFVIEECNLPTTDAGKECTDSSQCESACIASEYIPPERFNKRGECTGPADKGKPCQSVKDCGDVEPCEIIFDPIPGKGRCYGRTIMRGDCNNYVKGGMIHSPMCVD